ncbi:glycine--tRNA ligase subunit beta [Candidatus Venteria ishoeyi]|uniref:Glycine--tRNA ligase beta subunit n=1 Tax=Candidatus Venteria ishoeyi TaxID=1899563 RepID=A0A1H6F4V0_9GAMM|nr:glycine--tRNA ligase subunit beta [Candidatus Venteria ishoeyi]SEH05187.1 Glycine--tRNA ligase beta subunit [Candidatus Venteria ishoeyi]
MKHDSSEQQTDLLIEIGTEELPPKALKNLSEAFVDGICTGLENLKINYRMATPFATPRRLAVIIKGIDCQQAARDIERRGPAIRAAFDANGAPTKAASGFARSCGVEVAALETIKTDKGEWLVFRSVEAGKATAELIPGVVEDALAILPIPKRMRWGSNDFEFIRPVHWIVLLLGDTVIETEIMGIKAGRETFGHRFHHPQAISLDNASDYNRVLEREAHVQAVFSTRQAKISILVQEAAELVGGFAVIDEDLLTEVTSLVEWPVAVTGQFSEEFLEVPSEALIAAMKGHQKYFHVVDENQKLLPYFIAISNIESQQPEVVQSGNERVIRPRLADARFFWQQDCANSLESRLEKLKTVVFENKLGTLYDKSLRIAELSGYISKHLELDELLGIRAGQLCKCDLLTEMVGEFPELQGIMGEYYAHHDQENPRVANAIAQHYMPRHWGDTLPESGLGQAVALADRLDTLVGIFGIGKAPTGDKDPFGLRRAAIGVLRILIECGLPLDLRELLDSAVASYAEGSLHADVDDQVYRYILDRLRGYYQEQGAGADSIDAVLSCLPSNLLDANLRIIAVEDFRQKPEATSLAAANKRIHNILKKVTDPIPEQADPTWFKTAQERNLYDALQNVTQQVQNEIDANDYQAALGILSGLRDVVDNFFDEVMVMDEDMQVRHNRLALLQNLSAVFLQIADVSRLQM